MYIYIQILLNKQTYPLVIKHGFLENPLFIDIHLYLYTMLTCYVWLPEGNPTRNGMCFWDNIGIQGMS